MPVPNPVSTSETSIAAQREAATNALVSSEVIKVSICDPGVTSEWHVGSEIAWHGERRGNVHRDHGRIADFEPGWRLWCTHFSALTGKPDTPENYHAESDWLADAGAGTRVRLEQHSNADEDERRHYRENLEHMRDSCKQYAEAGIHR